MPVSHPVLLNQRLFAPYKIAVLVETVAEQGIGPQAVLAGLDLSEESLADPSTLVSIRQYIDACENVIAAGAEPSTPFRVGARLHLSAYGMYGYALLCCPTMRDYFDFAVKYHALATPTLHISWRETEQAAIWEFTDIHKNAMGAEVRRFLIRQQMAQHVTHVRDVVGANALPLQALISFPADGLERVHEQYLGCPCLFDQPVDELHYPHALLDEAPQLANRLTVSILRDTCDRLIGEAKISSGVAGEVYQILMMTPNQFPGMEAVADQLMITTRTLRRKLVAEQTSYGSILDDVRCSLATEYLRTTRMSTEDIAAKLGFSDNTNFRRAFKRWTGKSPRQVRDESR